MSEKYVFKILERPTEILLIIENGLLKFITSINEETFKLPYLKNKMLSKFLSKVIDKFQDNTLKLDYLIKKIDHSNLLLTIMVWDGKKHLYEIKLKSKELHDGEITEHKIKTSIVDLDTKLHKKILDIDRKYDDECDKINELVKQKAQETKKELLTHHATSVYRNYKFKSMRINKGTNKAFRSLDILVETNTNVYESLRDSVYEKIFDELKKYEHFNNFGRALFKDLSIADQPLKVESIKSYFMDLSIYNILEIILNNYGIVEIIYLNLDYNKATYKVNLTIKFLYDDSELRHYKCLPHLFKQDLSSSKLIYNSLSKTNIIKKDILDIFIFQNLK